MRIILDGSNSHPAHNNIVGFGAWAIQSRQQRVQFGAGQLDDTFYCRGGLGVSITAVLGGKHSPYKELVVGINQRPS